MATTAAPHGAGPDAERLELLDAEPGRPTTLDGAWWPRTSDLAESTPALVSALRGRGVRITRIAYNPAAWDSTLHKVPADDRLIRLGWFRSMDQHLISLTGSDGERVDLLVVPPGTEAGVAGRAMTLAAARGNRSTPTAVLEQAGREPGQRPEA